MELNQSILEMPTKRSGVYVIFNPITRKAYVGETNDFNRRLTEHIIGIYGNGDLTNNNLKKETIKSFEIFPVINSEYNKKRYKKNEAYWLAHETVIMYLFRKYGYELYNGNYSGRDNTGDRDFLIKNDVKGQELTNRTIEYLNLKNYTPSEILEDENKNDYYIENWEDFINAADSELNENIFKSRFNKSMEEFYHLSESERKAIWFDRLKTYAENNNNCIINENNYIEECNKLLMQKLSVEDLECCGLRKISVKDFCNMIKDGTLNNVIFSKFGHYLSQSPVTILMSKIYDIKHNKLKELDLDINPDCAEKGICFWAVKKLNEKDTRNFFAGSGKKSRYVIMPYTPSTKYKNKNTDDTFFEATQKIGILNPKAGESIDDFHTRMRSKFENDIDFAKEHFALGYTSYCNNTYIAKDFPEKMIPAVIEKKSKNSNSNRASNSNALLISEFSFVDVSYEDFTEFYKYFYSMLDGKNKQELAFSFGVKGTKSLVLTKDKNNNKEYYKTATGRSSASIICAALKQDKIMGLINFLENNFEKEPDFRTTSFIIAKIEYPYIVSLRNE